MGPTHTNNITEISLKDMAFVQEQLAPVGLTYALLGYTPSDPRSVIISVNGLTQLQGVDYNIDGRKIEFTPDLVAGNDKVVAVYYTGSAVADVPAVTIEFDIPGQDVRIGSHGALQILIDGTWYDMIPTTDPITGLFSYIPSDVASLNQ